MIVKLSEKESYWLPDEYAEQFKSKGFNITLDKDVKVTK